MRKCKIAQKVNRSFTTFVEGHDSVVVSSNFALKKKKVWAMARGCWIQATVPVKWTSDE